MTTLSDSQQKKITCRITNFVVPADERVKLKDNEKIDKYHDLTRELKKLLSMTATVIPFVSGALGTAPEE